MFVPIFKFLVTKNDNSMASYSAVKILSTFGILQKWPAHRHFSSIRCICVGYVFEI